MIAAIAPLASLSSLVLGPLILAYSVALTVLLRVVRPFVRWLPGIKRQLEGRPTAQELARAIAPQRRALPRAALFFCSSAGEYEQARPIIDRLERQGDVYVHVLFFSRSGIDFLKARGDATPAHLAPASDSVWDWGHVLAAMRPDVVAVVRHELWPGFLATASAYAKTYLICASRSVGESRSFWKRLVRGALMRRFAGVLTVAPADGDFFHEIYGVPKDRLRLVGDTKYDRALDRADRQRALPAAVDTVTAKLAAVAGPVATRRLVVGSAHPPDLEMVLVARRGLGDESTQWQILVVPHEVNPTMIARMEERCVSEGVTVCRYSALESGSVRPGPADVVIVDSMGKLAELYGVGTAAFVGGAVHRQVHNVLEPASHGLPLAFGSKYENSAEAVRLVESRLATPVESPGALTAWWQKLGGDLAPRRAAMTKAVKELGGAAERILAEWDVLRAPPGPPQAREAAPPAPDPT